LLTGCGGKTQKAADNGQPASKADPVPAEQLISKGKNVDGFSYDYVLTMPDGTKMTHKVWVESGNMRSEMSNPAGGEPTLAIVNMTEKAIYLYQPSMNQATKMPIEQSEVDTTSPKDYLGEAEPSSMLYMTRETFDGKDCLVYETNTDGVKGKMWIWEEYGMPLRVESQSGGDKVVAEFLNFKIGDIDDSLFRLPEGTKITDFSAMFQQ